MTRPRRCCAVMAGAGVGALLWLLPAHTAPEEPLAPVPAITARPIGIAG